MSASPMNSLPPPWEMTPKQRATNSNSSNSNKGGVVGKKSSSLSTAAPIYHKEVVAEEDGEILRLDGGEGGRDDKKKKKKKFLNVPSNGILEAGGARGGVSFRPPPSNASISTRAAVLTSSSSSPMTEEDDEGEEVVVAPWRRGSDMLTLLSPLSQDEGDDEIATDVAVHQKEEEEEIEAAQHHHSNTHTTSRRRSSSRRRRRATIRPSHRRQLSLSQLLKGRLYVRSHPLVIKGSKPTGTTVHGPFAEDLLLSVYNLYVNEEGYMDIHGWLRFWEDGAISKAHPLHQDEVVEEEEKEKNENGVTTFFDPERLFQMVLFLHATEAHPDTHTATLGHFWILLNRIAKVLFPDIAEKRPTEAMDRLLRNILLPLYMLHYGGLHCQHTDGGDRERGGGVPSPHHPHHPHHSITAASITAASSITMTTNFASSTSSSTTSTSSSSTTTALVNNQNRCGLEDPRLYLLLSDYASNLWQVFRHYAIEPLGRSSSASSLHFPEDAMISEWNFSLVYLKKQQVIPGREAQADVVKERFFFCISSSAFIRFAQDYGLCPHILNKNELLKIFETVVTAREIEGQLWSPSYLQQAALVNPAIIINQHHHNNNQRPRKTDGDDDDDDVILMSPASVTVRRRMGSLPPSTLLPSYLPNKGSASAAAAAAVAKGISNGSSSSNKQATTVPTSSSSTATAASFPKFLAGFNEFQEMLLRIAYLGLSKPQYDVLFPTIYAKLAALMMDWGVADMDRLVDLAIIRSRMEEGEGEM